MMRLRINDIPEFESAINHGFRSSCLSLTVACLQDELLSEYFPYKSFADICEQLSNCGFMPVVNAKLAKNQVELLQPLFTVRVWLLKCDDVG
jgi:hypothetical protein